MSPPEASADLAAADRRWMGAAIALSRRALGRTWPNPAVGCVLVGAGGAVLGRGWTQPGGRPHAEAMALAAARAGGAGAALEGATAYVTLEPCAHYGKTPPCADALAAAGVARVVVALGDPDPRVAGRGFARLAAAGAAVTRGVLAAEAEAVLEGYLAQRRRGRPFLTLKLAASLDGRIATASGESRWISSPESRARVHLLRAQADAVLIGAATAIADDAALTVRLAGLEERRPVRIVLDPALRLPEGGVLARTAAAHPTWLLHAAGASAAQRAALAARGVRLIETPSDGARGLALAAALAALGAEGLTAILCEGGGRLAAALLQARLADRLIWIAAGKALGADARPALAALALERLADAPTLAPEAQSQIGPDLWSTWRPA